MALTNHVYCPWMQLFDFLDFPYQFSLKQNSEIVLPKSTQKRQNKMQETHVFHVKYFLHLMLHYTLLYELKILYKLPLTKTSICDKVNWLRAHTTLCWPYREERWQKHTQ